MQAEKGWEAFAEVEKAKRTKHGWFVGWKNILTKGCITLRAISFSAIHRSVIDPAQRRSQNEAEESMIFTGALYQYSTVRKTSVIDDVIDWPLQSINFGLRYCSSLQLLLIVTETGAKIKLCQSGNFLKRLPATTQQG